MFNNFVALLEYDGEDGLGLYPFDVTSNKNCAQRISCVKQCCKIISGDCLINNNMFSAVLLEDGNIKVFTNNNDQPKIPVIPSSIYSINYIGVLKINTDWNDDTNILVWGVDINKTIHQWAFRDIWFYNNSRQLVFFHSYLRRLCDQYDKFNLYNTLSSYKYLTHLEEHTEVFHHDCPLYQSLKASNIYQYSIIINEFNIIKSSRLLYVLDLNCKLYMYQTDLDYRPYYDHNSDRIISYCDNINNLDIEKLTAINAGVVSHNIFIILKDGTARILRSSYFINKISIPNEHITDICDRVICDQMNQIKNILMISTEDGNLYSWVVTDSDYSNPTITQIFYCDDNEKTLLPAKVGRNTLKIKSSQSFLEI